MSQVYDLVNKYKSTLSWSRLLLPVLLMYLGMGLVYFGSNKPDITPLLQKYWVSGLGFIILMVGLIFVFEELRRRRSELTDRVSLVDERRRDSIEMTEFINLRNELKNIKASSQIDYSKIENILNESANVKAQRKEKMYANYASYFDGVREVLENKSADADEKASILLDKGTAYSRFGISIFIFSILGWQYISFLTGFKDQYIYGIVSCSVLFIFIEFLSAWFLRQYRSYVDTSTYLVKIKSIFDKYMLAYLALKDSEIVSDGLTKILAEEIVWPDSNDRKVAKNVPNEVLEAMAYLAKSAKKEAKDD